MAFSEDMLESLKNFDTDQLSDLNQVGSWPVAVKVIIWSLVFMGALGAGYFFHVTNLQAELTKVQRSEMNLRTDYEKKYMQAIHLDGYRKQQIEMEESFQAIVRQLPADTEIPGLIEDITLVGLKNGLSFTSIDLQKEVKHEFYIEKPIKIVVNGTYHELGSFVSDVADLSRIVTLHDFTIAPAKASKGTAGLLTMQILARTYRYNDDKS
ncbi:MAG: type 4a pilus biogenesis protein PilO [bacterium]|nr:pilus assembly protein PilP [Gammaproteobacteria bacterium]HIL97104.1 pilus assembly protein PilP [Pseudomonadales bacterium]